MKSAPDASLVTVACLVRVTAPAAVVVRVTAPVASLVTVASVVSPPLAALAFVVVMVTVVVALAFVVVRVVVPLWKPQKQLFKSSFASAVLGLMILMWVFP